MLGKIKNGDFLEKLTIFKLNDTSRAVFLVLLLICFHNFQVNIKLVVKKNIFRNKI